MSDRFDEVVFVVWFSVSILTLTALAFALVLTALAIGAL